MSTEKTKNFLKKLKDSGHYNEDYDYSKVDYINNSTKVIIIDKKWDSEHLQNPYNLLKSGPKCSIINAVNKDEYVINQFNNVHSDRYDYSKVDYVNEKTNIIIICKIHGIFEQTPSNHKRSGGCSVCVDKFKGSKEEFVEKYIKSKFYNYNYNFENFEYRDRDTKSIVIDKSFYNFEHLITPYQLLIAKQFKQLDIRNSINKKDYLIKEFEEIYGYQFDYSNVIYNGNSIKVKIKCKIHGIFEQTPNNHKSGNGCPICNHGWTKERILNFVNDIDNKDILNMDAIELQILIGAGKLHKDFEELVFEMDEIGDGTLKALKQSLDYNDEEDETENQPNYPQNNETILVDLNQLGQTTTEEQEIEDNKNLPSISNEDILLLDKELITSCDDEAVEFLVQYKLRKIWNEVINEKRDPNSIKNLKGGKNSTRIKELFLTEYDEVLNYKQPTGYNFRKKGVLLQPNMMQKLTVSRVIKNKRYGNWSGTGAGKTNSFIIASREIDAKLTLVVCLNSTIKQLSEDIKGVYPDSVVHTNYKMDTIYDRTKHNYLLLNYEKFQQGYSEELFQNLNKNNQVDFVVLDEIHNTKQRDENESNRRSVLMRLIGRSGENSNFHLLGMSATPVINNLKEAKSLLHMITGKEYNDLKERNTISNTIQVFKHLTLNGLRYIPKYDINLKELTAENTQQLKIDGSDLLDDLLKVSNTELLGLEKCLLDSKLEAIKPLISKGSIIYSYFTDGNNIPKRIAKYLDKLGLTYGFYTGETDLKDREDYKDKFIKGELDIMIASSSIGTGVDGLQDICNKMFIITLPWTDSEYTQLKGRIYRQGSIFGEVEIIIPQVFITTDEGEWSWDNQRLNLIRNKRTLADAAVDGVVASRDFLSSKNNLCEQSLDALKEWKERLENGKFLLEDRDNLTFPLNPDIIEYLKPQLGDFSELNLKWSTQNSKNTFDKLKNNPEDWYYYHTLYSEKRKEWSEIPYIEISKKIINRPDWIVGDFGCGENLLSKEIENKVYAFDHIAIDDGVIAGDMSNVPLEDNILDVVVFSLSLMGSNDIDYLKEAYRVVKPYGNIFICEPASKWEGKENKLKEQLESVGFKCFGTVKNTNKFIYIDGVKYI